MNSVCFTGHRRINITPALEKRLYETVEMLIKKGAENFYAGGAIGWDSLCANTVISLKKKYPNIKLHLILPCSNEEQTKKWNDPEKEQFYKILNSADNIEYISESYTNDCMKKRNARLVELAECCVCFYTGRYKSGTGQTVRMAEHKGILLYNIKPGD